MEIAGRMYAELVTDYLLHRNPEIKIDDISAFTGANFDLNSSGKTDQHSNVRNPATSKNKLLFLGE